ncbi:putative B3 domain-containing protein At5g66980 isoform X2 [Coffea arabica]|uniref:B3 domain-containing protein At5g66980 isoform X2 n=1 Tax=Coffea arabica TaxID=13443 RepID=A0ABM4VAP1_COFAR
MSFRPQLRGRKEGQKKGAPPLAAMDFPSFFKVLVHDSKSILRIPTLFVSRFEEILPQHALLKTKSGETWPVKIVRIDERYCFTDGWPKFVNDLKLEIGDLLVFWLIIEARSSFKVAIYGIRGCEKEFNSAATNHCPIKVEQAESTEFDLKTIRILQPKPSDTDAKRRKLKRNENTSRGAQKSFNSVEDRRFTKVMAKHHRYRLHVPLLFAEKTGLMGKTQVVLRYQNGWSTNVVLKQSTKPHMLDMCAGWPEFRKKNRLLCGKKCAFEYVPETDSIQVQLLEEQN